MKGRNIIITSIQAWDIPIGSNSRNIAYELAKENKVIYVNTPLDRITSWRERSFKTIQKKKAVIKTGKPLIEKITSNLSVFYPSVLLESINILPEGKLYNYLSKRNNELLSYNLLQYLDTINFKYPILFIDSDMYRCFFMKEIINPVFTIYYTRDNLQSVSYWKRHGLRMEPLLMQKVNCVVANSRFLAEMAQKNNPNTYYIEQGCDLDMYKFDYEYIEPKDIQYIPHPRVVYTGAILQIRLDINLILFIAKQNPTKSFIFIGKEDETFTKSSLHELSNVFFLGHKLPQELPAYLSYSDVCINPQSLNLLTIGNYPRKIDEYLAMGKPVVAIKTEAMNIFETEVYLAKDVIEFSTMINLALLENTEEKVKSRIALATKHSWKQNTQLIFESIKKTLSYVISSKA